MSGEEKAQTPSDAELASQPELSSQDAECESIVAAPREELDVARQLLRVARRSPDAPASSEVLPGTRFGDFEIDGACIGEGGCGDVYPAHDWVRKGEFAIKVARPGLRHAEQLFRDEFHQGQRLHHVNILVANRVGVCDGTPYLVFRRLEGCLTDDVRRTRYAEEEAILKLMLELVDALALAHSRAVLHCDLKPENILFDNDQRPCIADFGLARTIEAHGSSGDVRGGTRGWMSPEQVAKNVDLIGVQSDTFSLGVILYWLLSDGRLPFGKGDDFEHRLLSQQPEPLRAKGRLAGPLAWDLAAICRKALRKGSKARYQSANELKADLLRAGERLPLEEESRSKIWRMTRWARRHPALAAAGLCALSLPAYVFSIQSRALDEVRAVVRPQSRFSAAAQARSVVSELYAMSLKVHAMARDPAVVRLLAHSGIGEPAPGLAAHAAGFDSVNVFSADGVHHARWPIESQERAINVRYADHFRCAERLAHALLARPPEADSALPVCVAGAHRSRLDGKVKLGLSAPILGDGRLLGVAEASTMARDSFGAVQLNCGSGECFTALLGPRDRDQADQALPAALSVLAQTGVAVGSERRLPVEVSRRICESVGCVADPVHPFLPPRAGPFEIDPYLDPVSSARTVAIVAPVGRTGLSVLLATPYSATEGWLARIASAALTYWWLPLTIALGSSWLLRFVPNPRWPWPATERARHLE